MAESKENKVVFGLSSVHYAVIDPAQGTFGAPVAIPGGVKLAITRVGSSSTFHADNKPYATFETNSGYEGDLEIAYVPESFLTDVLGYEKDKNGAVFETSDAKGKEFALLYEVDSNKSPDRFVFYRCTASRPEADANTKTDTTTPDVQKLHFTASPMEMEYGAAKKDVTKLFMTKPANGATTEYDNFFKTVYKPVPNA